MNVTLILRQHIETAGSQKAAARLLGVSETYISDVIRGRKEPGPSILDPLGLERVVTYRRKRNGTN